MNSGDHIIIKYHNPVYKLETDHFGQLISINEYGIELYEGNGKTYFYPYSYIITIEVSHHLN